MIERRNLKISKENDPDKTIEIESLLNGWKKHKLFLIYLGINFGVAQVLFFISYLLAGAINGSLAQKTTVIFALLFGYIINKESIKKSQVLFSFLLLFGVTLAITQGLFNLLEFNLGIILMLVTTAIWMLGHAITKTVLDKNEATPIQLVFSRNVLSGIILFSTYFLLFPENFNLLFNPINIFYFLAMGVDYSANLFCWYKVLTYLDVSKASVLASPTPIVTAFFAIFLGEIFTGFHLIGLFIIIISIYFIVREKKRNDIDEKSNLQKDHS
ncbi:hypothetical protein ES703_76977 [subsurface metagenome]